MFLDCNQRDKYKNFKMRMLFFIDNTKTYLISISCLFLFLNQAPLQALESNQLLKVQKHVLRDAQQEIFLTYPSQKLQFTFPNGSFTISSDSSSVQIHNVLAGQIEEGYALTVIDKSCSRMNEKKAQNLLKSIPQAYAYTHFVNTPTHYIWMAATNVDQAKAETYFSSLNVLNRK